VQSAAIKKAHRNRWLQWARDYTNETMDSSGRKLRKKQASH
jgi:hypothetical protein